MQLRIIQHGNSLSILAQKLLFYWDKRNTKLLFCILLVFPTLSFLTPFARHWLVWAATRVQQMFPLYFRDIAILSCLQVCSLKHCRELHRAQFCSWVFCCPHREADGWWFFLLSGFSLSWEDFWANSPEQQQSRDELLGISRLGKGRVASATPWNAEAWPVTAVCCHHMVPDLTSHLPWCRWCCPCSGQVFVCLCTKHHGPKRRNAASSQE